MLESADVDEQARCTGQFNELQAIIGEMDTSFNLKDDAVFTRLEKTSSAINELVGKIFRERYGINGLSYDNIEQVFNPMNSGIPTMGATRDHLVAHGMNPDLADQLSQRYLNRLYRENDYHVCTLMDLFKSAETDSKRAISRRDLALSDIHLNM